MFKVEVENKVGQDLHQLYSVMLGLAVHLSLFRLYTCTEYGTYVSTDSLVEPGTLSAGVLGCLLFFFLCTAPSLKQMLNPLISLYNHERSCLKVHMIS